MRRRGRYFAILLGLSALALACNALSGAGDLTFERCETCGQPDAPAEAAADVVRDDVTGPDAPADVATRPSYCNGIVMYLRFDGTLSTAEGVAADQPPPTAFTSGKYGSAALLLPDGGALYYPQGDGGIAYPNAEGTIAIWFKAQWTWPSALDRVFYRTLADRANRGAGPFMKVDVSPSFVGSSNQNPDGGGETMAGVTTAELTPYWKDGSFNHLVQTWRQSPPTLTFTLNGATGDPTVTRRETNAPWVPGSPTVGFVRLSSNISYSDGHFDDVVMWSRVLSLAEIQAVYGAAQAVGDVCGL